MDAMIKDEQALVALMGGSPQAMMSQMILAEFRNFRDVEWRDFRNQVTDWRNDLTERVVVLEVSVKSGITGNGTPSRLKTVETQVELLNKLRWQLFALASFLSALAGLASWLWPRNGLIPHGTPVPFPLPFTQ